MVSLFGFVPRERNSEGTVISLEGSPVAAFLWDGRRAAAPSPLLGLVTSRQMSVSAARREGIVCGEASLLSR